MQSPIWSIALGTLYGYDVDLLFGVLCEDFPDRLPVKEVIRKEVDLPVADAVLGKGAPGGSYADHLFQRVVGFSRNREEDLPGAQVPEQGRCQGVGAAGDLRANQRILRVEVVGIHLLEAVPSDVIVAVAGGAGEVCLSDVGILHRLDNAQLIDLRDGVDFVKPVPKALQNRLCKGKDPVGDAKLLIDRRFFCVFHLVHESSVFFRFYFQYTIQWCWIFSAIASTRSSS